MHTHSRIYKNTPNKTDTNTHIVARTQSQNTEPQIQAIQRGLGPTNTKNPGKSSNLEEEPHKSLTVTGVKQNWKPHQEETACEAVGKPVVTKDSIETWWSLGNNVANTARFYFCYSEPYTAFQMLRWTSLCIHKIRHPVILFRRIINVTRLREYFIFTNFDNSHPKTSTGAELWTDVHIAETNSLCSCI
jgi:hypothetical protein